MRALPTEPLAPKCAGRRRAAPIGRAAAPVELGQAEAQYLPIGRFELTAHHHHDRIGFECFERAEANLRAGRPEHWQRQGRRLLPFQLVQS